MCECPKAVPEDPQYEENLPHHPLYAGVAVHGTLRLPRRRAHLALLVIHAAAHVLLREGFQNLRRFVALFRAPRTLPFP